jgi:hypothetical protein
MKRLLSYTAMIGMVCTTSIAFAKAINLYAEPKTDSKIVGSANTETGITIVYTPKNSEWIKIANPTNGDVGWVKSSELGNNGYNMRIITTGDGAHNYNIYQLGTGGTQYTKQQLEKQMQQFEQQQRMLQKHIKQMFNDMFNFTQPIFVPVVMMPEPPKASTAKEAQTAQKIQPPQVDKKN